MPSNGRAKIADLKGGWGWMDRLIQHKVMRSQPYLLPGFGYCSSMTAVGHIWPSLHCPLITVPCEAGGNPMWSRTLSFLLQEAKGSLALTSVGGNLGLVSQTHAASTPGVQAPARRDGFENCFLFIFKKWFSWNWGLGCLWQFEEDK